MPGKEALERVRRLLRATPLIDGHNDLPWQLRRRFQNRLNEVDLRSARDLQPPLHTDIERLRAGGVGAQFWSTYVECEHKGPGAARVMLEQIDVVHRLIDRYPEDLELALTAEDIVRIHAGGRVASLIGVEGGHAIEGSLGALRQAYRCGARYLTLTHNDNVEWADASTDAPEHGGLSEFGREVVREMNHLGMLVDLSHVAETTMNHALEVSQAPVVFSHSSAFAIAAHPRNVPDDVLHRLADNDGLCMVTFVPPFLTEAARLQFAAERDRQAALRERHPNDPEAVDRELTAWRGRNPWPVVGLDHVILHIEHIRDVAGIDHVGLGSDFDGVPVTPVGLEDVSRFPELLATLVERGWSDGDLRKLAGENLLRVLRSVERLAAQLRLCRAPSDMLLARAEQSTTTS